MVGSYGPGSRIFGPMQAGLIVDRFREANIHERGVAVDGEIQAGTHRLDVSPFVLPVSGLHFHPPVRVRGRCVRAMRDPSFGGESNATCTVHECVRPKKAS
jgi:hypothetical protein